MSASTDAMDEFEDLLNRVSWRPIETAPAGTGRLKGPVPARTRGDTVQALFFAQKAAETLQIAKLLGWKPESHGGELADKEG